MRAPFRWSESSVVVTGSRSASSAEKTLIEFWNGDVWAVTPSPNKGHKLDTLAGVTCTSSTSCITVGFYQAMKVDGAYPDRTLIETGS